MLIDLHTHTAPRSEDSCLNPDELIVQAKCAGLDAVCLTEHDWFWDAEDVRQLCQRHNFLVLPGVEITTEEAHLLVFGLERHVFGMHRASFVKRLVDEVGGAIIVAHPYRRNFPIGAEPEDERYYPALNRACESLLFQMADAIEVLNGRGSEKENAFSLEISTKLNLRIVAASDAHCSEDVGSCATFFERRIGNLHDLIIELKEGTFRVANLDPQNLST
ncbi:PHP-associated domain-containing protein [Chloroflexota bacterium]